MRLLPTLSITRKHAGKEGEGVWFLNQHGFFVETSLTQMISCHPGGCLTYVAPALRFQVGSLIFDGFDLTFLKSTRRSIESDTTGVPVLRLLEVDLEVLMGLLHRAASQCNMLLPPSEIESVHRFDPPGDSCCSCTDH